MASRRDLLILGALGVGAGLTVKFWPQVPEPAPTPPASVPVRDVTVGFIYVGATNDSGYNQSHANAARKLAQFDWINVVEQANVPEDETVIAVMQRMIEEDGAEFVFPTSYGYFDPYLLEFATQYPEVKFLHTGGLALPGHPPNISSSYGYIDEAMFLCGVIAAHTSPKLPMGFVGAIPIPVVRRNINAFTLGARQVNPDAIVHARFTGGWNDPEQEQQRARELFDLGIGTLACHVDSPALLMQMCEQAGVRAVGYHVNQSVNAPTQFITGAEWRWFGMYKDYIQRHLANKDWPTMMRGGLRDGMVALSPLAASAPPVARAQMNKLLRSAEQGQFHIYTGPVLDNQGEVMVPNGMQRRQDDPWLETMDWFVEGVVAG